MSTAACVHVTHTHCRKPGMAPAFLSPPCLHGLPGAPAEHPLEHSNHHSCPLTVLSSHLWRKRYSGLLETVVALSNDAVSGPGSLYPPGQWQSHPEQVHTAWPRAAGLVIWGQPPLSPFLVHYMKCPAMEVITHKNRTHPSTFGDSCTFFNVGGAGTGLSCLRFFRSPLPTECVRVKKLYSSNCLSGNIFSSLFHC